MTNYEEKLIEFGLSTNEAKIYLYLLQREKPLAGNKISVGTGLHRQYVYKSLEDLALKRIVYIEEIGKHKKYGANSPMQLEQIARERAKNATQLASELKNISVKHFDQDFEVIKGAENIRYHELDYLENVEENSMEYIIGGTSEEFEKIMGEDYKVYLKQKEKKNIEVRYLGNSLEKESLVDLNKNFKNQKSKFLPKLPTGICNIVIRQDSVSYYSFLNPPLLYILKSQRISENYKEFFKVLWEIAVE